VLTSPAPFPIGTSDVIGRTLTPEPERELPRDPVAYVREELDEWVWSRSADIMRAVVRNRHVAVKAAHDVSKSWTASRLAVWWEAAHPPGTSFVVTSAPSETQVKAILWREIGRAHRRGNRPGRITLDGRWYVGPRGAEELIGYGRKPQDLIDKEQAMQAFSGIHAEYVLVILDEAMGIPTWLWDAAESLTTNDASRILAIGNPDSPAGRFEEVCRPGSGWHVEKISVFDSPNFTGEPVPELLNRVLVSRQWEEERRERWGTDNPLYQSKVLAEFPDTSDEHVITPALVRAAQERDLPGTEAGTYGLDVARFGADSSTLYRDRGGVLRQIATWRKQDTHTTRKAVERAVAKTPEVPIVVDADGLGAAVFDEMRAAGMPVAPFTMTTPVQSPRRFANRRSEMWWSFREEMEEGLIDLDPDDEDLAAQLQQPKWTMDARGRIRVETKEEMAKRGLPSPDKADSCIMARFGGPSQVLRTAMRRPGGLVPTGRKMATAGLRERKM
jgi:hypothetical protein